MKGQSRGPPIVPMAMWRWRGCFCAGRPNDDPQAALPLGWTHDPAELRRLGIPNFQAHADPSKARERYRRTAGLGSAAAALRLERLP
jgi:hypothetical protein